MAKCDDPSAAVPVRLTTRQIVLLRKAVQDALRLSPGGYTRADRRRLVDVAEHALLRALLDPSSP